MAEIYLLYINYHDIGMTSDSLYAVYEDKELAEQNKATLEKNYPGADVFIDVTDIVRSEKVNDDTRCNFEKFYDEWKEKWLLRKALWIARKERAKSEKCYWMHIHQKHGSPAGVYYRINHRQSNKDGTERHTPREWYNRWMRVEYRCDKKLKEVTAEILKKFSEQFLASQKPLDPDDARLLHDHLFELM